MICLKIRTFVVSATTHIAGKVCTTWLWFAWKFVPLWYQQQRKKVGKGINTSCDLLENSYLCGISNNPLALPVGGRDVVICLKIRTFVVSATTFYLSGRTGYWLWFAWKFVPLWYQQQQDGLVTPAAGCCDLLENSYLCGISNNNYLHALIPYQLWFAWKFVPLWYQQQLLPTLHEIDKSCDLLENSYLCGISNNSLLILHSPRLVVICLKIRTFVVSATTYALWCCRYGGLWFAWKFVPLWYQQQLTIAVIILL